MFEHNTSGGSLTLNVRVILWHIYSMVLIKYQSVSKSISTFIRIVIYNRYEMLFFMDSIEQTLLKTP